MASILALLLALFAFAAPVAADHTIEVSDHTLGEGFDNPCGDDDAVKINSGSFADDEDEHTYTFEGIDGLSIVLSATWDGAELDSVTVVSVTGGSANLYVHAGEGTTLNPFEGTVIDPEKGISFVLFCIGEEDEEPPTPTLTLDKVTVNGDDGFAFAATGGFNTSLTGAGDPVLVASAAGSYTITETISAEQAAAGWGFTSVSCTGNAAEETPGAGTVTVTVGADEDVVCTFTNTRTGGGTLGGNPTPTPSPSQALTPREGTQAGLPDTAMDPMGGVVGVLALVALVGVWHVARRNVASVRQRD
jgi:hypothetical protein